jgi:N-ethylmaleimide reductase
MCSIDTQENTSPGMYNDTQQRVGVRLAPNGVFNDMGSPDYRETFTYVADQLNRHSLAYLHVMDGLAFGFHELGEPMMLADFRPLFNGALMGNCGYTQTSAEQAITDGDADLIAFGRPYLNNPDLVERFRNDWPLAPEADPEYWYTPDCLSYEVSTMPIIACLVRFRTQAR